MRQKDKQAARIHNLREDLGGAEGVFEPVTVNSFTPSLAPNAVTSFVCFRKSVSPAAEFRVLGERGICGVEPGGLRGSIWPLISCLLMVTADSVQAQTS